MSELYNVMYSPAALDDLRGIYSYIALQLKAAQTAKKQTERIRAAIRSLEFMPERYTRVDWEPWASMHMHKLPVDNYIVFYQLEPEKQNVIVIRIFYGGRNIEEIIKNS